MGMIWVTMSAWVVQGFSVIGGGGIVGYECVVLDLGSCVLRFKFCVVGLN